MLCALTAFFLFAVMNAMAKILAQTHHVAEIAFYRNLVAVVPMLFWIYGMNNRHILTIHSNPKGIIARAILGTISLAVTFAAYAAMPFADTTAFLFASSLIVPVFGFFFLSERVGPYRWSAILIGFIGVLIMCQPTGDVNTIGISLALSAALIHATLQTIVRALGKTESPETVTFYFVFIGVFVSLIPMPFVFTMPTWNEVPLIIGLGLTGLVAQLFISRAYKYAEASIVTVFNYSGIIWAMLIGWLVWGEFPTHVILIGAAIVIASNLFILYRENKLARLAKATLKKTEEIL
jgi:drug/metabolite transporter (DMT)-like permease